MIKAVYDDKELIINILTQSFDENQSVNYIVKQDTRRINRIKALMDYSFETCYTSGGVFLSTDKKACALVLFPDKKKTTLNSITRDVKLILSSVGIENIGKALSRESKIRNLQPKAPMYYLWFIGVDPNAQHKGIGSALMNDLIEDSVIENRAIFLETSTLKNLPWYKRFGFEIYNELDLTYKLFFLKRELSSN